MKTNEQLLKFYGVELNKKYIITDRATDRVHVDYIGEKFKVVIRDTGSEGLCVRFDNIMNDCYISLLNGVSYEPCPEEILDKAEKEYLRAVIKPFRNKYTIYIVKFNYTNNDDNVFERISITMTDGEDGNYSMFFPSFSKGLMYKGMKVNKEYTLEELGL